MAFPLNTAGTATVIPALPFTTADTFGGVAFGETWFTFTGSATHLLWGAHLATDGGVGDIPTTEPFLTVTLTPAVPNYLDPTHPIQLPVSGGVAVYFKLTAESGTALITFSVEDAPTAPITSGTIVVPDPSHEATFPATVLAFGADAVVHALDLGGGDQVDCLPSGIGCLAEIPVGGSPTVTQVRLFQTLAVAPYVLTLLTVPNPLSPALIFVKQDHGSAFYLATSVFGDPPLTVVHLLTDGTTPQTWTLPGSTLAAFAVSVGGTKAYTSDFSTDTPIGAYDLVAATALPNFAAGVSGAQINSLTVLADDSVVATYLTTTDHTIRLRRYAADGSLLATWDAPGTQGWVGSVACGADDPVSVVVRTENTALTTSTFWHLRASDFAVLDSFTVDNFDNGQGHNATAQFFGPSEASSFFVWSPPTLPGTLVATPGVYGIGPTETGGGTTGSPATLVYSAAPPATGLRASPQRRLRRAPHLADEQRWLTYDRFQLDLQTGVGLVSGQGSDPQIMLRWSNDGGHTWSNEHWTSAGKMGATKTRAIWRQLGRARTRTFEVVVSDPVRFYLAAAYVDVTPGDS